MQCVPYGTMVNEPSNSAVNMRVMRKMRASLPIGLCIAATSICRVQDGFRGLSTADHVDQHAKLTCAPLSASTIDMRRTTFCVALCSASFNEIGTALLAQLCLCYFQCFITAARCACLHACAASMRCGQLHHECCSLLWHTKTAILLYSCVVCLHTL